MAEEKTSFSSVSFPPVLLKYKDLIINLLLPNQQPEETFFQDSAASSIMHL